jgi:hypothetical protein
MLQSSHCPRTYPEAFADRIRELFTKLITGGEGTPEVDERESPEAIFESLVFTTWPEAKLMPVVKYIRGNKGLKVPSNWLSMFPRPFEILHQLELQREEEQPSSGSQG